MNWLFPSVALVLTLVFYVKVVLGVRRQLWIAIANEYGPKQACANDKFIWRRAWLWPIPGNVYFWKDKLWERKRLQLQQESLRQGKGPTQYQSADPVKQGLHEFPV